MIQKKTYQRGSHCLNRGYDRGAATAKPDTNTKTSSTSAKLAGILRLLQKKVPNERE
jgi:hypothetical protein